MGLWDTLKRATVGEAQRLFLSRPDEAKGWIVYRWPDDNIRRGTQCTVEPDEVAVFVRQGKVAGILPPGRHTVDGDSIPWLGLLVDGVTGGNLYIAEVYFVSTRQIHGVRFGGEIGRVKDPETELRVRLRAFGECTVQVSDPTVLLTTQTGLGALHEDLEGFKRVVAERVMLALSDDVGELVAQKRTGLDLVLSGALKEELLADARTGIDKHLNGLGLSVVAFQGLNLNPDDADWADLKKDAEELRSITRDARRAQVMNDVELERRAKLAQLAGGYGSFAGSEALIGAGAGMAKGGESSALTGAGLGLGMAMATGMGAAVAKAGGVVCGACKAQVAAGRFCASCGSALPQHCACGAEVAAGSKFCSSCGKAV